MLISYSRAAGKKKPLNEGPLKLVDAAERKTASRRPADDEV